LPARVAAALAPHVFPGANFAVGLSGGLDSVTLLYLLSETAPALQVSLRAVHVDHGLSPNAPRWADFCVRLCEKLQIPLQLESVNVASIPGAGLEDAARSVRYDVFARVDADFLVLAHHRDDQAETLLLRLLRGAGVRGLAAMLRERPLSGARARLLRPLLETSRAEITAYARARGLEWVEDESNSDTQRRRNFLRLEAFPLLERQFPAARATIAHAAAHLGEARGLLEEMAREDFERIRRGEALEAKALLALGEARAKNLLRDWIDRRGLQAPAAVRLTELMRQLLTSREDAKVAMAVADWNFRLYRGMLYLEPIARTVRRDFRESWDGANAVPLLELGGVLRLKPEEGRGLSVAKLRSAPVTMRVRRGGERLRLSARGPRRTLKNLFQEGGVPPWRRDRLPLVFCGDALVSVPGIGDAHEFKAAPGEAGLIVAWEPFA
jgi:tRNA(Ile)-lysidine synthase